MWNYTGWWESCRGDTRVSSLSWESGGPSHWDLCPRIMWDVFDRGWEFGICLRNLPTRLSLQQNLISSFLLAHQASLLYQVFWGTPQKRWRGNQWVLHVLSSSRQEQSFTLLYACMHAPCVPPCLGLCAALLLLLISQDFSVFYFVAPRFSVAWQSYSPCSDFSRLYWKSQKPVCRYSMHVKTFVDLVKIRRNVSLTYFWLKPKNYYSH